MTVCESENEGLEDNRIVHKWCKFMLRAFLPCEHTNTHTSLTNGVFINFFLSFFLFCLWRNETHEEKIFQNDVTRREEVNRYDVRSMFHVSSFYWDTISIQQREGFIYRWKREKHKNNLNLNLRQFSSWTIFFCFGYEMLLADNVDKTGTWSISKTKL